MPDTRYCPKCGEECGAEDRFCSNCRTELRSAASRPGGGSRPGGSFRPSSDTPSAPSTEMGLPANAILLDRYKILKLLGAGGMGRVYLADDLKLSMPVAIKVLHDILTQDPVSVKRLITEAKTSILLAHPNILRLHNFEDGVTAKFLVMEYVDGESLAEKIAREGKLSEDETRSIAIEVCKGLEHAHSKKVVHRDMKPGNVMLGKDGSVKIADFGLARLCHDSIARMTSQLSTGTLQYMSPEQLDGEIGESSDLYALGVTLYEMLSGDPPFVTGEITGQIRNKVPKPIEGLSPEISPIVMKCLEKKKENRFASVCELREELDATIARCMHQTETKQHLESLIAGGKKDFDEGKFSDAAALREQAPAPKPGDAELEESAKRARAQASSKPQGQQQEEHKGEIDQQVPIEALKARGSEAFNAGRFGDAIAIWQGALALNPGDPGLCEMVSVARKQADLVIKESERCPGANARQEWLDRVVPRANAMFQTGTYREAESMLQQALQMEPTNAQFMELLTQCREKLKEVQKKKIVKPRSKRKLLYYAIGLAVILIVIIYIAVESDNSPSPSYNPPAAVDNPPAPVDRPPVVIETPPPPLDIVGNWTYTVTQPNGTRTNGQMVISGNNNQLRMVATAAYSALGPDGWMHNFRELNYFAGSLTGNNMMAHTTSGTLFVDGVAYAPQGHPLQLDLQVSSDGLSMNGQVSSSSTGGAASVSAQRQR